MLEIVRHFAAFYPALGEHDKRQELKALAASELVPLSLPHPARAAAAPSEAMHTAVRRCIVQLRDM